MGLFFYYFTKFADHFILVYSCLLFSTYFVLSTISAFDIINYIRKNSFIDYRDILTAPSAPAISIIAPAYNESKTIVENVRSLLNIHYVNFEVIIINDGSKDDTLQLMIDEYQLEPVPYAFEKKMLSKPVRAIYKSKIRSLSKLTVVDKVNGGKADALNAGINVSKFNIFAAIDVDCIKVRRSQQAIFRNAFHVVVPKLSERTVNYFLQLLRILDEVFLALLQARQRR